MKKIILFLSAVPRDGKYIQAHAEYRLIKEILENYEEYDLLDEVIGYAEDLANIIEEKKPNIIHIASHAEIGKIVFVDTRGNGTIIDPDVFIDVIKYTKAKIDCIVLNACDSYDLAEKVFPYVDCVIGMKGSITDDAAHAFSQGFYESLKVKYSCLEALKKGCIQIGLILPGQMNFPNIYYRQQGLAFFRDGSIGTFVGTLQKNAAGRYFIGRQGLISEEMISIKPEIKNELDLNKKPVERRYQIDIIEEGNYIEKNIVVKSDGEQICVTIQPNILWFFSPTHIWNSYLIIIAFMIRLQYIYTESWKLLNSMLNTISILSQKSSVIDLHQFTQLWDSYENEYNYLLEKSDRWKKTQVDLNKEYSVFKKIIDFGLQTSLDGNDVFITNIIDSLSLYQETHTKIHDITRTKNLPKPVTKECSKEYITQYTVNIFDLQHSASSLVTNSNHLLNKVIDIFF